jgi:hypothetical protein
LVHTKNIVYPLCVCERASSFILVFVQKLIRYTSFPFTIIIIPRFFFSIIFSIILFIYFFGEAPGSSSRTLAPVQTNAPHTFFFLVGLQLEYGEKTETLSSAPSLSSICACYYILCIHFFFFLSPPLCPSRTPSFFLCVYSDIRDVLSIIVIIIIR